MKKVLKIVMNVLAWIVLIFALLVTIVVFSSGRNNGVANLLGYIPLTVESDSMLPTFAQGDMIICKEIDDINTLAEGDVIMVEKLAAGEGEAVVFDQVLTVVNDADVKIGTPVVEGAKVTGKVEAQGKDKKILVFKYKAKSNYRKRQGHRQPFTKVVIEKIEA